VKGRRGRAARQQHGRGRADLVRFEGLAGCVLVDSYTDEHGRLVGVWECPDVEDGIAHAMSTAVLLEGLTTQDASVNEVPLVPGSPADLHAFIQARVRFTPEPVETFQSPATTLALGYGDCDDSARALVAIARRRGIPARLVYFLQDGQPAHVAAQLYQGGWRWAETTIHAHFGEHPFAAMRRLGLKRSDMSGEPVVLVNGQAMPLSSGMGSITMRGMQIPANKTPATPQEVADALISQWNAQLDTPPAPESVAVLLAQWALETGEGASMIQWNIGNVKASQSNPDTSGAPNYVRYLTREYINGAYVSMLQNFRAFATLEDGVGWYLQNMRTQWTNAWPSVLAGDPQGFAVGLRNQKPFGYYTAPASTYAAGVQRYFDKYLGSIDFSGALGVVSSSSGIPSSLLLLIAAGAGAALARLGV